METYKSRFIDFMIDSGVLTFGDFTTKSGRKTPYFVNTGNYRMGRQLSMLGDFYAQCVHDTIGEESFDVMFGPAYKGIPLATVASSSFYRMYGVDKSVCFNRKEAKDHGEAGILIGKKLADGDKVIIIEDVITAGTAVRETYPILKSAADVSVKDMFISVDRCEVGQGGKTARAEIFEEFGITVHPIVTVVDILDHVGAKENAQDIIPPDTQRLLKEYMEKYCII